jgi:F0F1-type ATP synthase membrane subunit b/b'
MSLLTLNLIQVKESGDNAVRTAREQWSRELDELRRSHEARVAALKAQLATEIASIQVSLRSY